MYSLVITKPISNLNDDLLDLVPGCRRSYFERDF